MNALEVIRKAADCGYTLVVKDGKPFLRGPKPVEPPELVGLCQAHRDELVSEIHRLKSGDSVLRRKPASSKELQIWLIGLVKIERMGMVMIDGVPVCIHAEATALLSKAEAWEHHDGHDAWMKRVEKLRAALEWPVDEGETT